ncbi:hypothetical protein ACFL2G_01350 [Candidatus Omnitrophota bacterium]
MKKILTSTIFLIFILAGQSFANTSETPPGNLGVEIGFETSYITYKEPSVMKQKGGMCGVNVAFTYRGWVPPLSLDNDRSMLKIEARGSYGQVDYTSESGSRIDGIDDRIFEIRGLGGYSLFVSDNSIITPYVGYGYRYLNDDMAGKISTAGAAGYERQSNYYYIPIGIESITVFEDGDYVEVKLEYDYFCRGKQMSLLGAIPGYVDIKNNQGNGHGYRGSIKFHNKGEKIDFFIEPFIRYWSIAESEKAYYSYYGIIPMVAWEPKNNSKEFGMNFTIKY